MKFPHTIRNGSVTVRVYKTPVVSKGKRYDAYLVRYHFGDKIIQKKFAKLEPEEGDNPSKCALSYAKEAAERIGRGTIAAFLMDDRDKASYQRAKELLGDKPVEIAAAEYAEMKKILGDIPPTEAARFYVSKHPQNFIKKTVPEVKDEMIASKKRDGVSPYWLNDLKVKVGKLAEKFSTKTVGELNGVEINEWLHSLSLKGKTWNNYRGCIQTFISFAKSKKYLPHDFSEMLYIKHAKITHEAVTIYTPEELQKLLKYSSGSLRLFVALGAYAGLRSSEIARLQWESIKADHLVVAVSRKRGARRRIVPLCEPLKEILSEKKKAAGRIWPAKKENPGHKQLVYLKKRSGVDWKHNALRHSFISYRLAEIQNAAQVALECGTSEDKIFTNYREMVTKDAAKEWFATIEK